MAEQVFITAADAAAAQKEGAALVIKGRPGSRYFADWGADQLRDFAGTTDRDLTVRTTLDPRLQDTAEAAIADVLAQAGPKDAVGEGALVALAPAGAVRAMVGGRDYNRSHVNRATQPQ